MNGSPLGMMYRTTSYASGVFDIFWYEKNIQGDVVAVYNDAGTKLVNYIYDAWGYHTISYSNGGASTAAQYNPFRYRGYYFDKEMGMYYLQSRYYDPYVARFISPDNLEVTTATPMGLTDKNLYAYCDNNPITRIDGDGEFWNILIGAGTGAAVGAVASAFSQLILDPYAWRSGEFWAHVGVAAGVGAISGGLAASGVGLIGQVAVNAGLGAIGALADTAIDHDETTTAVTYLLNIAEGAAIGAIAGRIGGKGTASKHVSNSFWRMLGSGADDLTYYFSQIGRQAKRDGLKAIPGIVKATIPSLTKTYIKASIQYGWYR